MGGTMLNISMNMTEKYFEVQIDSEHNILETIENLENTILPNTEFVCMINGKAIMRKKDKIKPVLIHYVNNSIEKPILSSYYLKLNENMSDYHHIMILTDGENSTELLTVNNISEEERRNILNAVKLQHAKFSKNEN